jgi:hypothetical protein
MGAGASWDDLGLISRTERPRDLAMTDLATFRSIIELWPSREAMAAEIGAGASAVSKWWQRDSVPAEWWSTILLTDVACANCLTAELLTALAAREPVEARA